MRELKTSITQITHGREYEGEIECLGKSIQYKLLFGVPINELDSQKMPEDKEAFKVHSKKLFGFTVTKEGQSVELSDKMFGFMLATAGKLALTFYNNPQSKDYNSGGGIFADALRNKENSFLGALGAKVSIGMSNSCNVSDEDIPNIFKE